MGIIQLLKPAISISFSTNLKIFHIFHILLALFNFLSRQSSLSTDSIHTVISSEIDFSGSDILFFFYTFFSRLYLLHSFRYRNHSNFKMFSSLRTLFLVFSIFLPFLLFKIKKFFSRFFLQCKSIEEIFKSS